ncbi:MAG TPA: hypothetical protein VMT45_04425 [Thermoanaerobaculaceae bacterium]|nr:hypothetical protein [Thermoanaerobaculaceae bacterium]
MRAQAAIALGLSVAVLSVAMGQPPSATPHSPGDPWAGWRFVLGEWLGGGSGKPGEGSGSFSFRFDLGEHILVRRSHTEYPAADERPAVVHDDVMICYPDPAGGRILAIYFDNEGHVIRYVGDAGEPGRLVLVSEAIWPAPTFRLTYTATGDDAVTIAFEIAPPGHPDAFTPYLTGRAIRQSRR